MRIYYEDLKKVLVPVPSFQEQQEIVNFIERINSRFDVLHNSYGRQEELLMEYRAALIHEYITGQHEDT